MPEGRSIDDLLATLSWVRELTDASLAADRVHRAFVEVIFGFVDDDDGAEDGTGTRLRTAAEKQRDAERERRRRRDAQRALEELREGPLSDDDDDDAIGSQDDDDGDDGEDISMMNFETNEFMRWIETGSLGGQPRPGAASEDLQQDVEFRLERTGLGRTEETITKEQRPERLVRSVVEPKMLIGGELCEFPLNTEVYWILRQLRNPGQPFAHNTRVCALASRPYHDIADERLVVALGYAIEKITRDYVEPAHLMMYHQTALHPLLCALLEGSALSADTKHTVVCASYAYNSGTGQRQEPHISEDYVGFSSLANHDIGEGDPLWYGGRDHLNHSQRKPCFIELGRLLIRITELDRLFRGLEYRRQRMMAVLKDAPDARVQDQRTLLGSVVFESAVEADIWQTFIEVLQGCEGTDTYVRVRALGLDDAFEEFTITGLQYQENLRLNTPLSLCPTHSNMKLYEWAANVGSTLEKKMSGEQIISLFTKAIVSQFCRLPILCMAVVDIFCAEGDLIVNYTRSQRADEVFSLASLFTDHPRYFLELLEMERNGVVKLFFVLDQKLVYNVLNLDGLYQKKEDNEWWRARDEAMSLVVIRLLETLPTLVRSQLTVHAEYTVSNSSATRLSAFCAQGPYTKTRLELSDFDGNAPVWDPQWNVVEALPIEKEASIEARSRSRVCSAFRGSSGVTAFTFIDENGTVTGSARWVDCALSSVNGRERAVLQAAQLKKLFLQCRPTVVAVAASSVACLPLVRTLEEFVRDQVNPALSTEIPVVWTNAEVARFYSATSYARTELPHAENIVVTSVALARYVQDPLQVLCALFDNGQTALQLCRTAQVSPLHDRALYQRLEWEMSLWVSAVGWWVDDLVYRPNGEAILQFVPGFGSVKARAFAALIGRSNVPCSRQQVHELLGAFGNCVAQNATGTIRVGPPEVADVAYPWHPLDETLVPLEWHALADAVAEQALGVSSGAAGVALIEVLGKPRTERRQLLRAIDWRKALTHVQKEESGVVFADLGQREVELVMDEMIAGGASFARRPYRHLTTIEFMNAVTGITFLSADDVGALNKGTLSFGTSPQRGTFVIREGDYITGTVSGVRGRLLPGIRLTTSSGVNAFIAATDISDEGLRVELLEYIRSLESARDRRGVDSAQPQARVVAPEWLRRGSLLQGLARRCHWSRCELHLTWCRPREDFDLPYAGDGDATTPSYTDIHRGATSSANSLNTTQVEQQVRVFATKMSRHPLFRDITKNMSAELLRDKEIGEVLLRPRSHSTSRVVCEVKVGATATIHWTIAEERRPSGAFYYVVTDRVIDEEWEFSDVDDFLCNFVERMVKLIQNLREHRRFEDSIQYVQAALESQAQLSGGFAYAFAESERQRHLYEVFTCGGGDTYRFPLHITSDFIYVRLPFFSADKANFRWVPCKNAEHLSHTIKNYARSMSQ